MQIEHRINTLLLLNFLQQGLIVQDLSVVQLDHYLDQNEEDQQHNQRHTAKPILPMRTRHCRQTLAQGISGHLRLQDIAILHRTVGFQSQQLPELGVTEIWSKVHIDLMVGIGFQQKGDTVSHGKAVCHAEAAANVNGIYPDGFQSSVFQCKDTSHYNLQSSRLCFSFTPHHHLLTLSTANNLP